jgi:hypothetical protein
MVIRVSVTETLNAAAKPPALLATKPVHVPATGDVESIETRKLTEPPSVDAVADPTDAICATVPDVPPAPIVQVSAGVKVGARPVCETVTVALAVPPMTKATLEGAIATAGPGAGEGAADGLGDGEGATVGLGDGAGATVGLGDGEGAIVELGDGKGVIGGLGSGDGDTDDLGHGDGDCDGDTVACGDGFGEGVGAPGPADGEALALGVGDADALVVGAAEGDTLTFGVGDAEALGLGDGDALAWTNGDALTAGAGVAAVGVGAFVERPYRATQICPLAGMAKAKLPAIVTAAAVAVATIVPGPP